MKLSMDLTKHSVDFDGIDVDAIVLNDTPDKATIDGAQCVSSVQVVYTEGQPSIPHYQVRLLVSAARELELQVVAVVDHVNPSDRTSAVIYLGKPAASS